MITTPKTLSVRRFRRAIKAGDINAVKKLIDAGEDVNASDWESPKRMAVLAGRADILGLLLDNGAEVVHGGEFGEIITFLGTILGRPQDGIDPAKHQECRDELFRRLPVDTLFAQISDKLDVIRRNRPATGPWAPNSAVAWLSFCVTHYPERFSEVLSARLELRPESHRQHVWQYLMSSFSTRAVQMEELDTLLPLRRFGVIGATTILGKLWQWSGSGRRTQAEERAARKWGLNWLEREAGLTDRFVMDEAVKMLLLDLNKPDAEAFLKDALAHPLGKRLRERHEVAVYTGLAASNTKLKLWSLVAKQVPALTQEDIIAVLELGKLGPARAALGQLADINSPFKNGRLPVVAMIEHWDQTKPESLMKLLEGMGANPLLTDHRGVSPLDALESIGAEELMQAWKANFHLKLLSEQVASPGTVARPRM